MRIRGTTLKGDAPVVSCRILLIHRPTLIGETLSASFWRWLYKLAFFINLFSGEDGMVKNHVTDFLKHIINLHIREKIRNNYIIMPRISATNFKPIQVCFRFFCSEATQFLLKLIVPKICPHIYFLCYRKGYTIQQDLFFPFPALIIMF